MTDLPPPTSLTISSTASRCRAWVTWIRAWFRARRKGLRIVLFPLEAATGLLWFLVQCLFAVDAILILAAGAAFLLYVVRIVKPETFPWLPG